LSGAAPTPMTKGRRDVNGMSISLHEVKTLDERLRHIQGRIAKGKVDPQIYALARQIVSQKCGDKWCTPEKNNVAEAQAIFAYLRKNVRYTSDILNVDSYQNPRHTLGFRAGDCDDYSITGCSLLLSIGIPCRLKVIQTKDSKDPNHIYAQAGLPRSGPTKWFTMDASVDKPFGWEAPRSMIAKSWIYPPTPGSGST
jgi:transglutaminase-like putative cysteine protease